MYAPEIISLVVGTVVVLAVPALIWSSGLTGRFRNGRRRTRP